MRRPYIRVATRPSPSGPLHRGQHNGRPNMGLGMLPIYDIHDGPAAHQPVVCQQRETALSWVDGPVTSCPSRHLAEGIPVSTLPCQAKSFLIPSLHRASPRLNKTLNPTWDRCRLTPELQDNSLNVHVTAWPLPWQALLPDRLVPLPNKRHLSGPILPE